jgi:hypothetical protein
MSITTSLSTLFARDLSRLIQQIDAFPNDESLWQTLPGITNSAGNLALHIEGNLREYIGRQLGHLPYNRKRDLEFSLNSISRQVLADRIADLKHTIASIVSGLSPEQLEAQYPEPVQGAPIATQQFLLHLYGHLNWHLGQIDYLRRTVTGDRLRS